MSKLSQRLADKTAKKNNHDRFTREFNKLFFDLPIAFRPLVDLCLSKLDDMDRFSTKPVPIEHNDAWNESVEYKATGKDFVVRFLEVKNAFEQFVEIDQFTKQPYYRGNQFITREEEAIYCRNDPFLIQLLQEGREISVENGRMVAIAIWEPPSRDIEDTDDHHLSISEESLKKAKNYYHYNPWGLDYKNTGLYRAEVLLVLCYGNKVLSFKFFGKKDKDHPYEK